MNTRMLLVTTGGLGLLRPAPGSWGSLPPVFLAFALAQVVGPHWTIDAILIVTAVLFSIACVRFGAEAEERWGKKDPGQVVADETAGQSLALLFLPWAGTGQLSHDAMLAGTAFLAFRFFDILKPPPAHQLQRIKGGWGILIDDLVAGVMAGVVTQLVARLVM